MSILFILPDSSMESYNKAQTKARKYDVYLLINMNRIYWKNIPKFESIWKIIIDKVLKLFQIDQTLNIWIKIYWLIWSNWNGNKILFYIFNILAPLI